MITEAMVERAIAGEKVRYRNAGGKCMLMWRVRNTLRFSPQLEEFCE